MTWLLIGAALGFAVILGIWLALTDLEVWLATDINDAWGDDD